MQRVSSKTFFLALKNKLAFKASKTSITNSHTENNTTAQWLTREEEEEEEEAKLSDTGE